MTEKVICWNHRGASSAQFLRELKGLRRLYNSVIVILLEPKVSGAVADDVCERIGMSLRCHSEDDGFRGGGWLLWNEEEIRIEIKYAHWFFVHITVSSTSGKSLEMTAVYVNPKASRRRAIWGKLDEMSIEKPWILTGDFSCLEG